jgi:hypothetical protein
LPTIESGVANCPQRVCWVCPASFLFLAIEICGQKSCKRLALSPAFLYAVFVPLFVVRPIQHKRRSHINKLTSSSLRDCDVELVPQSGRFFGAAPRNNFYQPEHRLGVQAALVYNQSHLVAVPRCTMQGKNGPIIAVPNRWPTKTTNEVGRKKNRMVVDSPPMHQKCVDSGHGGKMPYPTAHIQPRRRRFRHRIDLRRTSPPQQRPGGPIGSLRSKTGRA